MIRKDIKAAILISVCFLIIGPVILNTIISVKTIGIVLIVINNILCLLAVYELVLKWRMLKYGKIYNDFSREKSEMWIKNLIKIIHYYNLFIPLIMIVALSIFDREYKFKIILISVLLVWPIMSANFYLIWFIGKKIVETVLKNNDEN